MPSKFFKGSKNYYIGFYSTFSYPPMPIFKMLCLFICFIQYNNGISQQQTSNLYTFEDSSIFIQCAAPAILLPNSILTFSTSTLDSVQLQQLFHRILTSHFRQWIGQEKITLRPTPKDLKALKQLERKTKKQLKQDNKLNADTYKFYLICQLLQNEHYPTPQEWQELNVPELKTDQDLLALLITKALFQLDAQSAKSYIEQLNMEFPSSVYFHILARFYIQQKQFFKASKLLTHLSKTTKQSSTIACTQAALQLHTGYFSKAFEIINAFPETDLNKITNFDENYFKALETLVQGDLNDAFKRLKAIHAQSPYYQNTAKLLEHFFH